MSAAVSNPDALKLQIQQLLSDDLKAVGVLLRQQFRNPGMFIQDVAEHVSRFQGKQIRPILTLLSARMFELSDRARQHAQQLATVVELIHSATLVHDDVIDDSDLRRHVATVHRRWNTETSVLFGDYLFSKAFHLAALTGDAEACRLIGRATNRTCEGELNQIAARLEQSHSELDYFRVVGGKTGQLFSVSCVLGARVAGATEQQQRRLRQFGTRIGLAFQIVDDVLDLTESSRSTGKDAANDLVNHRLTLPLLRAIRLSQPGDRNRLVESLANVSQCCAQKLRGDPAIGKGIDSAMATARHFVSRAVHSLRGFPECDARVALEGIARFALCRTT